MPAVARLQPLGYSLMDEWVLGTEQARTDYSDSAVNAFRTWIRERYPDLVALNAEWGTRFARWDDVVPAQVEQARKGIDLKNPDWSKLNLAPFVDYRLFMDTVGPTAFAQFAETIRTVDPLAKVGLCGTESNSTWFGHDWFHLCRAIDFICGYGDASTMPNIARGMRGLQRELQRSFRSPGALLSCWVGYHASPFYRDQALKLLLHDFHGIAYFSGEPRAYADFPYLDYDFTLSRRALDGGAGVRELRRGLDQLVWHSTRGNSGVAVLLSQPSLHVATALDRHGQWGDRCVAMTQAVEDAGLQYEFVAPEQVEKGVLKQRAYRVLLMPGATCLSDAERAAVRAFAASGAGVVYDRRPGVLDGHGKSRSGVPLLSGKNVVELAGFPSKREANATVMRRTLARFGVVSPVTVKHDAKTLLPTEIIVYRNGDQRLVSVQTDQVSWDKAKPIATIVLPVRGYVYDVRTGRALGRTQTVRAALDPMHILLYAVLPYQVRAVDVKAGSSPVKPGNWVAVRLAVQAQGNVGTHFLRVALRGPDGRDRPAFARTVRAPAGRVSTTLHFALNDPPGVWQVTARDAATGVTGTGTVEVRP